MVWASKDAWPNRQSQRAALKANPTTMWLSQNDVPIVCVVWNNHDLHLSSSATNGAQAGFVPFVHAKASCVPRAYFSEGAQAFGNMEQEPQTAHKPGMKRHHLEALVSTQLTKCDEVLQYCELLLLQHHALGRFYPCRFVSQNSHGDPIKRHVQHDLATMQLSENAKLSRMCPQCVPTSRKW